jgi:hypothetical protein
MRLLFIHLGRRVKNKYHGSDQLYTMTQNIENPFSPCLYIFKFFGCYSLKLNHPNRRRNASGVMWSLFIIFYCMSHSIYGISQRNVSFKSLLLTITDSMQIYISLTNSAVSILVLLLMRNKVHKTRVEIGISPFFFSSLSIWSN